MRALLSLFLAVILAGHAAAIELSDYVGDWAGDLEPAPGVALPLVLHVTEQNGDYAATLDSPSQGSFGMIATELTIEDDGALRIFIGDVGATYTGLLSEDGGSITGTFEQNGLSFPLTLVKGAAPSERQARPQEPGEDRPYREEELSFSGTDGVKLTGTLVLPEGKGPFPGVVLLNGSGPQDRDEYLAQFNHKPFLVLSDHLARAGIASFRYDDRGVGDSEGAFMPTPVNVFAEDAALALTLFKARPEIARAGYLGHSEGGLSAALAIGDNGAAPAFLVTLAGPYKQVSEILLEQAPAMAEAEGYDEATVNLARQQQQLFVGAVLSAETPEQACPLLDFYSAGAPENQRKQLRQLCTPYFWSLMRTDPVPHLKTYQGPVLALFGGLDKQVLASTHAPIAREILNKADGTEVIVLDDKNHLFQTAETGAMSEYGKLDETMSPEVMSRIAEWIHAR